MTNQTNGDVYVSAGWDHYADPADINANDYTRFWAPCYYVCNPGDVIAFQVRSTAYNTTPQYVSAGAMRLFEMATSGNCIAATIYWLKIMGGPQWRQDQNYDVDVTADIRVHQREREEQGAILREMTPEQIRQIAEWQRQARKRLQAKRAIAPPAIETTAEITEQE